MNYPKFFTKRDAPMGSGQFCELRIRVSFLFVSKFNKENNINNYRCYQVNIIFTKKYNSKIYFFGK